MTVNSLLGEPEAEETIEAEEPTVEAEDHTEEAPPFGQPLSRTREQIKASFASGAVTPEEIDAALPEGSKFDQFAYGFGKKTQVLENAYLLLKAGLSEKTIGEIRDEEGRKHEAAYSHLPLRSKEGNWAKGGGFLKEVLDPVYATVPALRIGQVAKNASIGSKLVGRAKAGVSEGSLFVADEVIDSVVQEREINPNSLALQFSLGTVLGGAFVGSRAADEVVDVSKAIDRPDSVAITPSMLKKLKQVEDGVVTEKEQEIINQIHKKVDATNKPLVSALNDVPVLGAELGHATRIKQQYADHLEELSLKHKMEVDDPQLKQFVPKAILEGVEEADAIIKNAANKYEETSQKLSDGLFENLEGLDKAGILNGNTFARAITRPLMGAATGYGIGVTNKLISDEPDSSSPWVWALAGLTGGQLSKKIISSNMSVASKEAGLQGIEDMARRNIWAQANQVFSGSHSAWFETLGGTVKNFGDALFRSTGAYSKGITTQSVEETTENVMQQLNKQVNDKMRELNLVGPEAKKIREAAYDLAKKFKKETDLVDDFSPEEIATIKDLAQFSRKFSDDYFNDAVQNAGLAGVKQQNYGLAQMFDMNKIAANPTEATKQFTSAFLKSGKGMTKEQAEEKARNLVLNVRNYGRIDPPQYTAYKGQDLDYSNPNLVMRSVAGNIEKTRQFDTLASQKEIQDFFIKDVDVVLKSVVNNNTASIEFARRFGANGEGVRSIISKLKGEYDPLIEIASKADDPAKVAFLQQQLSTKIKAVHQSVDIYFGNHHGTKSRDVGNLTHTMFGVASTFANLTYLPKAAISGLGDIVQPFQNSGAFSAMKGFGRAMTRDKQKDFASLSGFDTRDVVAQELRALYAGVERPGAGGVLNKVQQTTRKTNEVFFKAIGLAPLTSFARRYAYNAGVEEGFKFASKIGGRKIKKFELEKAKQLGLTTESIEELAKFKNVDEAFANDSAKEILNRLGIRQADRDALIPQLSNRRAFSQSRDPYIRSLGQFLSWAQAKTSQLNGLVKRVEDGDAALAIRAMGSLVLYDGILTFRDFLNDPTGEKLGDQGFYTFAEKYASDLQAGRTFVFSGNVNWLVDKMGRTAGAAQYRQTLESISPVAAWVADLIEGGIQVGSNIADEDYEGATKQFVKRAPLGKEILDIGRVATGGYELLEDRRSKAKGGMVCGVIRKKKDKGGIALVPNAPAEPDQRIDKMTGVPYDEQAGEAYTDVEDRQGLIAAVLGKKLQGQASV